MGVCVCVCVRDVSLGLGVGTLQDEWESDGQSAFCRVEFLGPSVVLAPSYPTCIHLSLRQHVCVEGIHAVGDRNGRG